MKIQYLGISEIRGPLVVLDHVKDICFDEVAELVLNNGQVKAGACDPAGRGSQR